MSRWYVDASATLKLIQKEAESPALVERIHAERPTFVACRLLETEMRRAAARLPELSQEAVSDFLEKVDLHDVPGHVFTQAGLLPGAHLRSLDAIHLAAAVATNVDAVLTYDTRMAESARELGLRVLAPA